MTIMAKVISLVNMKGGVGKSTLAANIAWHYSTYTNWAKRVLAVDLDPQFNLSQYLLGINGYEENVFRTKSPTIWDIFEQYSHSPNASSRKVLPTEVVKRIVTFKNNAKIDLIPSRLELAFSLKNPAQKELLLTDFLSKINEDYDLIVIDCPPTESLLTTSAYVCSDYVLVPVRPEFLSTVGLPLLAQSIADFNGQYQRNLTIAGIVFNGITNYSPEEIKSKEEVNEIAKMHGWYVFNNGIRYSRSYPKGAREGQPIFWTSYRRSEVSNEFAGFAQELAERIGL
jgi:chromosome partitioning protein